MADVTLAANRSSGPAGRLTGDDAPYDLDSPADGRLAFYTQGRFGEEWKLTASADTREGPIEELFSNFMDKSPEDLFRRIDPDYHYPTLGDDGSVDELAPTAGKFFVRLRKRNSQALWGNFKVSYLNNELAHVDRGLYGANLHYESDATTSFGEDRLVLDSFAAEPGTVPSREEFRGTGGSLYFLRRQDLLAGSERVRIEIRDKDSGLVSGVVHLSPVSDYDVDYLQGRILLSEPLAPTADDRTLVRSGGSNGDEAWLIVQYEFTPGFDEVDALATGGQGQYWLNDSIKLGLTANRNEEGDEDSSLYGSDLTLRRSADSWLKVQTARSEGLVATSFRSGDAGFSFTGTQLPSLALAEAGAHRAELSIGLADLFQRGRGRLSVYGQRLDAGYSAPGLTTLTDTDQLGGQFRVPLTDRLDVAGKADWSVRDAGLETSSHEIDFGYRLTDHWSLSTGVRRELLQDHSPVVSTNRTDGVRTDAALQLGYDSGRRWSGYGFGQTALSKSGDREDNGRFGVGGAFRLLDRLLLDGEVSHGDLGPGAKLGASYQLFQRTNLYLSYALDNERAENGLRQNRDNLVTGARTRLSDSASVYLENRYDHGDASTGSTRTLGMTLAPTSRWNLSASWDFGTLLDRQSGAETTRNARSVRIGYGLGTLKFSSGVEYRLDELDQTSGVSSERTTWLFRNTLKYQMTPDWRLVGKLNHSFSDSSLGQFYDGGYSEAELGYAYRPVNHDRLHVLAKYTFFYNVPSPDQVTLQDAAVEFIQKSHIAALDFTYDLTPSWSVGGKYAYRLGQASLDREEPDFFDNSAHLYILRTDVRFRNHWEGLFEVRMLDLPDLSERRAGSLVTIYRYLGDHFKLGIGYNFTDFSEDLTDLSYDHRGFFVNLVATM
jgi:hypothetical protein